MGSPRKHDDNRDELDEGVAAFASEDEPQAQIQQPVVRRDWRLAAGIGALIVVGILMATIDWRRSPMEEQRAPLPGRAVVTPGDARVAAPAIEARSVATTGSVAASGARARADSSLGQRVDREVIPSTRDLASRTAALEESSVAAISGPPSVEAEPPPLVAEPAEVPVTTETVTIVAHSRDRVETDGLLRAYAESYNRMDVASMVQVWPTVDTGALSRAFSTLSQQHLAFDSCAVEFASVRAIAECAGQVRYVPRVGDPTPRVLRRVWTIEMQRSDNRWQIAAIAVR